MKETICEKGRVCIFLQKDIVIEKRGLNLKRYQVLTYFCNLKLKYITSHEKYQMCKNKQTNTLGDFYKKC